MRGKQMMEALDGSGMIVTATSYNKGSRGEILTCSEPNCNARLSFVSFHVKNVSGERTPIHSHFRLFKGQAHSPDCRHGTFGQKEIAVAYSKSEVKKALQAGVTDFRINAMYSSDIKSAQAKGERALSNPSLDRTEGVYRGKGVISNYLKNIYALVEIYKQGINNPFYRDEITLHFGSKEISWREFFFSNYKISDFYTELLKCNKRLAALVLKYKSERGKKINGSTVRLLEFSDDCTLKHKRKKKIVVAITNASTEPAPLKDESYYMVYGEFFIPQEPLITSLRDGDEISIKINNLAQIASV